MKTIIALTTLAFSSIALAGKTDLEPKDTAPAYVHAASTKASKGKDKELTVKGGKGSVQTESSKPSLVDRKSKN